MKRKIVIYGLSLALVALLLSLLRYYHFIRAFPGEIYVTFVALLFMAIGVWAGQKLTARKINQNKTFETNTKALKHLRISDREMDVLRLMAEGYSNQQIAERLYISIHTVKTHVSNLLAKLDVNRRTQAIRKARSIKIIR